MAALKASWVFRVQRLGSSAIPAPYRRIKKVDTRTLKFPESSPLAAARALVEHHRVLHGYEIATAAGLRALDLTGVGTGGGELLAQLDYLLLELQDPLDPREVQTFVGELLDAPQEADV